MRHLRGVHQKTESRVLTCEKSHLQMLTPPTQNTPFFCFSLSLSIDGYINLFLFFLYCEIFRFGFRTDGPNGRSARRPATYSAAVATVECRRTHCRRSVPPEAELGPVVVVRREDSTSPSVRPRRFSRPPIPAVGEWLPVGSLSIFFSIKNQIKFVFIFKKRSKSIVGE